MKLFQKGMKKVFETVDVKDSAKAMGDWISWKSNASVEEQFPTLSLKLNGDFQFWYFADLLSSTLIPFVEVTESLTTDLDDYFSRE